MAFHYVQGCFGCETLIECPRHGAQELPKTNVVEISPQEYLDLEGASDPIIDEMSFRPKRSRAKRPGVPNGAYKTKGAAKQAAFREYVDEFVLYQCEYGFGHARIGSAMYDDLRQGFCGDGFGDKWPARIIEVVVADPGGQY